VEGPPTTDLRLATTLAARPALIHCTPRSIRLDCGNSHGWFTEGFDTADLKDAKALLDELNE
jgi:hypothetical protein